MSTEPPRLLPAEPPEALFHPALTIQSHPKPIRAGGQLRLDKETRVSFDAGEFEPGPLERALPVAASAPLGCRSVSCSPLVLRVNPDNVELELDKGYQPGAFSLGWGETRRLVVPRSALAAGLPIRLGNVVLWLHGVQDVLRNPSERPLGLGPRMSSLTSDVAVWARLGTGHAFFEGETGVGKGFLARYAARCRGGAALAATNCAYLIGDNMMRSTIFGFWKGAFDGADRDTEGLAHKANGRGFLFLDEVQALAPDVQTQLNKLLDEREVVRLGRASPPERVDLRAILATNKPLDELVAIGQLNKDFKFRIRKIFQIPPLRDRREDLGWLFADFLKEDGRRTLESEGGLIAEQMLALLAYDWPGNVRELEGEADELSEHLRLLKKRSETWLPFGRPICPTTLVLGGPTGATLAEGSVTRQMMLDALNKHTGSVTRARKELGLSNGAWYRWATKYRL